MLKRILESRYLPWMVSIIAVVVMLPAVKTGLVMDDLGQRFPQLPPAQIPAGLFRTGYVPDNSGRLFTVMSDLFGFPRDRNHWKMAKNYGILPWWLSDDTQCSLWRPLTSVSHWLDYRLYPDRPVLMHIHNILWFAAIVFLAAVVYRKIIGPTWAAGLAALMYVLDSNTYFPVMFVANRGFLIALCFGLLCFLNHRRWRMEHSKSAAILSFVFFALSLAANEAGVSTFAFILAYALVLDDAPWPKRFLSLLPVILIIIIWRVIYQSLGYGVSGIGAAYLDPGHEPLEFLTYLPSYMTAIIAGQLSAIPPDAMMGFNMRILTLFFLFYIVFAVIALILLLPVVWKNRLARFWFAVMLFAAIPVVAAPSGKNFGFVAVGAFGLIAVFTSWVFVKQNWLSGLSFYKHPACVFCMLLLVAHIPGAVVRRYAVTKTAPALLGFISNPNGLKDVWLSQDSHVVIVNAPCTLSLCAMPVNNAYYGRPVPRSIHTLGFAYTALDITRSGDKTLIIKSKESNLFMSDQRSPMHFSHAFAITNRLLFDSQMFKKNQLYVLDDMTVEILVLDENHLPRELAFTFHLPLEDENFCWLQFNWRTFLYESFTLPKIGETVTTQGPPFVPFHNAVQFFICGR
jgi:hypothetical protein